MLLFFVMVLVGEATETVEAADDDAEAVEISTAASANAVPARLSDTSAGADHDDDDANPASPLAWRGVEKVN